MLEIPKREIVVGDIVMLNAGDEIPADGILLSAVSVQVNESSLTGEPMATKTTIEADFDKEATYPSNAVMNGSTMLGGYGVMQVTQVGDATEYGKVYTGSQIENNTQTPLDKQLNILASFITKAELRYRCRYFYSSNGYLPDRAPRYRLVIVWKLSVIDGDDSCYGYRRGCSRRITDECHAQFGDEYEAYAGRIIIWFVKCCLRNDGCGFGDLYR